MPEAPRRYLRTRERPSAQRLARALAKMGFRPNGISVLSVVFAMLAGSFLFAVGTLHGPWVLLVVAAACIQLRLLCNMLDGLLAIEGGFKTPSGDLYNEIPDRLADAAILIGAGYAVRVLPWGEELGWAAALLALFTAYVRLLAGSLGARQLFIGPMAKQHRMFVLTTGCLLGAIECAAKGTLRSAYAALLLIVIGAGITSVRRILRLAAELSTR